MGEPHSLGHMLGQSVGEGGYALMMGRLPPGQRWAKDFPVLHLGQVPVFNPQRWHFSVDGAVMRPLSLTWEELLQLPRQKQRSDFHCVTGWSRLDDEWEGIPARVVLALAQRQPEANHVLVLAEAGYTTNLPLTQLLDDDVLLALSFNGQPLGAIHGGPVRLLVPKLYAYKSAKWVTGFRVGNEEVLGFWEQRGYSNTANPWTEDR